MSQHSALYCSACSACSALISRGQSSARCVEQAGTLIAFTMAHQEPAETRDQNDPAFDPFRRHDQYGLEGAAPQSVLEYLRLAIAAVTILPLKLVGCLALLIGCYSMCKLSFLFPAQDRAAWVAACAKFFVRAELFCLGFVTVTWQVVPDNRQHKLPPGTKAAGIGVSGLVKERMEAAAKGRAAEARPMLLFPEGTTTNGEYLLPFKSGAFLAGAPVQPVLIHYGKGKVSPTWESIDIKRQLFLMLCNTHSVTAYELPIYAPSEEEQQDSQLYAQNVRQYMLNFSKCVPLTPSNSSLQDKRAYHKMVLGERQLKNSTPLKKLQ